MTRAQRALVLAHECGHHRLGHVESEDGSRRQSHRFEHEADCEAVRILRREFGMTQAEVTEAISVLRHAGPANDTHPGSRARIRYSMGCLSR